MYKKVSLLSPLATFLVTSWSFFSQHTKRLDNLQVTESDIEEFEANYRGSDTEQKDLLDLFKKVKGNMDK